MACSRRATWQCTAQINDAFGLPCYSQADGRPPKAQVPACTHTSLRTVLLYLKIAPSHLNFSILVNNTAVLQRARVLATLEKPPLTQARQAASLIYTNQGRARQVLLLLSTLLASLGERFEADVPWVTSAHGGRQPPREASHAQLQQKGARRQRCVGPSVPNILGKDRLEGCCWAS